jgi:hypothetical protein
MNFTVNMQSQEVLKTCVFFVDREKLLREYPHPENFKTYEILPGKIGLRGEFWMGAVGLEGDLGLLIPPAKRDVNGIGYSIRRGEWDWWRFLSCITLPRGNFKLAFLLSFSHETFFDASQDVVCSLESHQLQNESQLICTYFSPETTSVSVAWGALWNVLEREFFAQEASVEFQVL